MNDNKFKFKDLFKPKPNQFLKIYFELLEKYNLTPNEAVIFSIILNLENCKQKTCFASDKYLSDKSNLSTRTVQRIIPKLIKKKLIVCEVISKNLNRPTRIIKTTLNQDNKNISKYKKQLKTLAKDLAKEMSSR